VTVLDHIRIVLPVGLVKAVGETVVTNSLKKRKNHFGKLNSIGGKIIESKIRRIQDRWLKEIPEFIAMRCKGEWIYFKRVYYKPFEVYSVGDIEKLEQKDLEE